MYTTREGFAEMPRNVCPERELKAEGEALRGIEWNREGKEKER